MPETTFSWESLEQFIGRKSLLAQAEDWLKDSAIHLVFYTGGFGIGKTRLLKQILALGNQLKATAIPFNYIDLYHAYHHSDEGLARALVSNFGAHKDYFFAFELASQALEKARAAGDNRKAAEYLRAMLRSCEDGMKRLSNDHGILVLLDTAEQWVYPTPDSGQSATPAWIWLKSWITELPKGMVVLAGRPVCEQLASEVNAQSVRLDYFNAQETRDYISAIARNYQANKQSAEFVLSEQDIPLLHDLSEGRPILLSLYLQMAFQNIEIHRKALTTNNREELEEFLVRELMNSEIGEALRVAGRAPKGVDIHLFTGIRGLRNKDGSISNENLEYAKGEFEQLKKMSFAKTFRESDRLFLHDEMYDMLRRHIYFHKDDPSEAEEAREAASQIFKYYTQLIDQKNQELKSLYERLSRGIEFEEIANEERESVILAIRAIEAPRQNLITEFISYRWRHEIVAGEDPIEAGLRRYYRFVHETASSGRYNLVVSLRIELLSLLKDMEQGNPWRPFIQGLLLIQKVWENLALGENYGVEIPQLLRNLDTIPNLPAHHKSILAGFLNTWQGTAIIFSREPDYERARQLLSDAIENIQAIKSQDVSWFKDVADSLAHRQLAYLYRVQGQFDQAIRHFVEALKNSRAIDFYHEEATLRNDLGFAQMMVGKFQAARENIEEGLKLRYRVGIGTYIALSNSTLAQYHIATNIYDEARKRARYAVKISQAIGYERGEAFGSLSLAEATRRYAFSPLGSAGQETLMNEAENTINAAANSFEKLGEEARVIESRLERGCLFRDKMRIVSGDRKDAYYQKALEEFEWTAEKAGHSNITYRRADALCNIIWLNFFAGKHDLAEQAAEVFAQMPELASYWLKDGKPADETKARLNPILWSQIGKYHTARGMLVFETWRKTGNKNALSTRGLGLRECASNFLLGLHYSILFAPDHRGLREGRRTVYAALTLLNREELKNFSYHARELAGVRKLSSPTALEELMREQALWFGPD